MLKKTIIRSRVGDLCCVSSERALYMLAFNNQSHDKMLSVIEQAIGEHIEDGKTSISEQVEVELQQYFAGERQEFTVPIQMVGTPFQQAVWQELLAIPYGETRSYRDVAMQLGSANKVRAVGLANGANKIVIIIPCHRVVQADGTLGGYSGGVYRKEILLDVEQKK